MEKQKVTGLWGRKQVFIMLLVYLAMIMAFVVTSYAILIRDLKTDQGSKAMVLAMDITHWLDLDQEEYDRLLGLNFNDLLLDPRNIGFEKTAREVMEKSEIKYIYLLSELPKEKAKYKVDPGEEADYNAPAGKPLTGVYMLDAVLSDQLRLEDTGGQGYTDKSRYTILRPEIREIMKKREPAFLLNTDEWGTYMTGYAPYYSGQGEFLGLVGVDIFPEKYYDYIKKSMTVFGLFLFILFLTGLAFTRLLTRVWKAEERNRLESELATQDALTGLINRRRFLGLLAHEHAVCRREGMPLTLALVDLEGFTQFNRVHGEAKGDEVLKETADFLNSRVKRGSDALCRFGGDEFAFFLHNTEAEHGVSFSEALVNEAPHPLSMGILVIMAEEVIQMEALLKQLEDTVILARKAGSRKYALVDDTR